MHWKLYFYDKLVYLYLVLVNTITFIAFIWDKSKAKQKKWRIPESRLLLLSLLGGSIGALLGMFIVRHKTNHLKFTIGIPLMFLLHISLYFYLIR